MPPIDPNKETAPANVVNPEFFSTWDYEAEALDPKKLADCYCENGWMTPTQRCQSFYQNDPDGKKVKRDLPVSAEKMNRMLCNQFSNNHYVNVEWVGNELYFVRRWKGRIGPRPPLVIARYDEKILPIRNKDFILFPTNAAQFTIISNSDFDQIRSAEVEKLPDDHLRYIVVPTNLREENINFEKTVEAYFDATALYLKSEKTSETGRKFSQIDAPYESGVYIFDLHLRKSSPEDPQHKRRIVQLMFLVDKSLAGKLAIDCAERGECEETWKDNIDAFIIMSGRSLRVDEVRAGIMAYRYEDSPKLELNPIPVYRNGAFIAGAMQVVYGAVTGGEFSEESYLNLPGSIGLAVHAAVDSFDKDEYDSLSSRDIVIISPRLRMLLGFTQYYPMDTMEEGEKYAEANGVGVHYMFSPIPMPEPLKQEPAEIYDPAPEHLDLYKELKR